MRDAAGREKNEELKTKPKLWTSYVTLTTHNSDLALSWCNISKNAPAAINNRHNNNIFQSLTNFRHFCKKKKNPNITSMKQEQYTLSISCGGSVGGEIMYL